VYEATSARKRIQVPDEKAASLRGTGGRRRGVVRGQRADTDGGGCQAKDGGHYQRAHSEKVATDGALASLTESMRVECQVGGRRPRSSTY
jgi:hypothetical protein